MTLTKNRVACVGSGLTGQGWAALFALKGYRVVMHDITEEILQRALRRVESHMQFLVDSNLCTETIYSAIKIEKTTNLSEAVRNAGFVIESVYESYDVKKQIFSEMDSVAPEDTILASSTSGLLMTEIQKEAKKHPERCIVAHLWNPVHLVPLVELSPGEFARAKFQ